jgi:pre-rRNA-processing protein TSR3
MSFHRGKPGFSFDGGGFVLLAPGAPVVSTADAFMGPDEAAAFEAGGRGEFLARDDQGRILRPVLLLDSVWRLLPGLRTLITGLPLERSLPLSMVTAYPRVSKMTEDPLCGLASVEALYGAMRLMGFDCPELLDGYRWRAPFMAQFQGRQGM